MAHLCPANPLRGLRPCLGSRAEFAVLLPLAGFNTFLYGGTMKEFVLIFRMDILNKEAQPSEEQMKLYMKQWVEWTNEITGNNQLLDGGNHLQYGGKLLMPHNVIIDTPYIANNESIAGYILISAENIDDAVDIAKKCPILSGEGTSVEIRQTEKLKQ